MGTTSRKGTAVRAIGAGLGAILEKQPGMIGSVYRSAPGKALFNGVFNKVGAFLDQKKPNGPIRVPAEHGQGEAYKMNQQAQLGRLTGRASAQYAAPTSGATPEKIIGGGGGGNASQGNGAGSYIAGNVFGQNV